MRQKILRVSVSSKGGGAQGGSYGHILNAVGWTGSANGIAGSPGIFALAAAAPARLRSAFAGHRG